jgi:hypothetical protein
VSNPNLDEYFTTPLEEVTPPPIATDYEEVQQEPHKTAWARGGVVYAVLGGTALVICSIAYLVTGGGGEQETAVANKDIKPMPVINPAAPYKSKLWFSEQANKDKAFMNKKKGNKKVAVKPVSVPPRPTPSYQSSYSGRVTPLPSQAVAPSTLNVSELQRAYVPRAIASLPPQPKEDPNQAWARIAEGSTVLIPDSESVTPDATQYDTPQAQDAANWQTVQGDQPAPVPTLGKTVPMDSEVAAILKTPVSVSGTNQQAVMSLDEPLKVNGEVILPSKTLLVASVQSEGALMNLRINTAYLNGQQLAIPGDSIMVLGANKQFLVAKSSQNRNGIGKGIRNFALGMIGGVADQALNPSSSTTISNGTTSTTVNNVSRSLTNTLLGGARGGVNQLIQNIQSQNQGGEAESPVIGLRAGTRVRLVFTAPTNI